MADDTYRAYLDQVQRCETLDRETEYELAKRWLDHGDRKSADRLISANLRSVVKIASTYRNYGIRVADLVEEGNIGLLEALKRYDPDRGHRFMTYAAYWVRAYILSHVLRQRYLVGVGTGPLQSKLFFRLARERARLVSEMGNGPDIDQRLAETFGTTEERVRQMSERMEGQAVSLDAELQPSGTTKRMDLLSDDTEGAEERYAAAERRELVRRRVAEVMKLLPGRERYIVRHRLLAEDRKTLEQIGRRLGVSRERVRQIEERVKAKLQSTLADLVHDGEPVSAAA